MADAQTETGSETSKTITHKQVNSDSKTIRNTGIVNKWTYTGREHTKTFIIALYFNFKTLFIPYTCSPFITFIQLYDKKKIKNDQHTHGVHKVT